MMAAAIAFSLIQFWHAIRIILIRYCFHDIGVHWGKNKLYIAICEW